MVAFLFVPLAFLWTADNYEFLDKTTGAEWHYVGYHERSPGLQSDGAYALTMEVEGRTFILFKQQGPERERQLAGIAE